MKSLNGLISSIDVKRLRPNNIALRDMLSNLVKNKNIPSVKTIEYKDLKLGRTSKVKFYRIDAIRAAMVGKVFYSKTELQEQFIKMLKDLEEEQATLVPTKEKKKLAV